MDELVRETAALLSALRERDANTFDNCERTCALATETGSTLGLSYAELMRGFALLWLAFAPALAPAQKVDPPTAPAWLEARIAEYRRLPPSSPPRSVVATRHEGKKVYYVSAACCDIPSELYDEQGTLLCYPAGGFAGGDGRCPTFVLGREPLTRIWRDERAPGASPARASGSGK